MPNDDLGERLDDERDYSYPGFVELFDAEKEWAERYDALAEKVLRSDEELSRKNRELLILAFGATEGNVNVCENHIELAIQHGASNPEIYQTLQVAGWVGSSLSLVTGAEALSRLDRDPGKAFEFESS